jgi:pyridoxine/pyridoxamine 5'-phosphate oxidase
MKNNISPEVEATAIKIAKGTQKIGQTKEQTKLITQGIEKGIAEYKKYQSKKLREIDKQRKQKMKHQENLSVETAETAEAISTNNLMKTLPWILLASSWLGFFAYIAF